MKIELTSDEAKTILTRVFKADGLDNVESVNISDMSSQDVSELVSISGISECIHIIQTTDLRRNDKISAIRYLRDFFLRKGVSLSLVDAKNIVENLKPL